MPALWVFGLWATDGLGPKPVTASIRQIGDWAIRILVLSLAVSPLRFASGWNKLVSVRRMTGVGALAYVLLHFALYTLDQRFIAFNIAREIVLRFYLTIGFAALLGLAALGATSTDAMIKRLGAPRWNRLHKLIFPIAVLAIVHDLLQARTEIGEACLLAGIAAGLVGERIARAKGAKAGTMAYASALGGLAVLATGIAFGLEAAWLAIRNNLGFWRVFNANFDFSYQVRPGWFVLAAGLGLAAVAASRVLRAGGVGQGRAVTARRA